VTSEKLRDLEALRDAADSELAGERSESIFTARLEYATALHNAAPELIAAARRLEALEEAMRQLEPTIYQIESVRDRADQILKERSK